PGFGGGAFELLAELREDRALILAGGLQLRHLRLQPRLRLGNRLALALSQLGQASHQALLDPVEGARPFRRPLLPHTPHPPPSPRRRAAGAGGPRRPLLRPAVPPAPARCAWLRRASVRPRRGGSSSRRGPARASALALRFAALSRAPRARAVRSRLPRARRRFAAFEPSRPEAAASTGPPRSTPSIRRRRRLCLRRRRPRKRSSRLSLPARAARRRRSERGERPALRPPRQLPLRPRRRRRRTRSPLRSRRSQGWIVVAPRRRGPIAEGAHKKRRTSSAAASEMLAAAMKRSAVSGAAVSVCGPIRI